MLHKFTALKVVSAESWMYEYKSVDAKPRMLEAFGAELRERTVGVDGDAASMRRPEWIGTEKLMEFRWRGVCVV